MLMQRHRLKKSAGFTLIELLVVIAIIAILAAMLVPGLAKSKQEAQAVGCINNTKQLCLAWAMYASENNDHLVSHETWWGAYMDWNPAKYRKYQHGLGHDRPIGPLLR